MSTTHVVLNADCIEAMQKMEPDSIDSVVTDPPYDLTQNKKGGTGAASLNPNSPAGRSRIGTGNGGGFMGKDWDATGIAFKIETWSAVLRVAKPGAFLLACGGSRTFHRMMIAIEDAGWELRDTIMWVYGSGFPKSLDVSKAFNKSEEALLSEQWEGWGTALKPAFEPIVVARKPLVGTVIQNVARYGTGAINIDGCRIASGGEHFRSTVKGRTGGMVVGGDDRSPAAAGMFAPEKEFEPTNHEGGRWPANLIHDGSEEVLAGFPDSKGQAGAITGQEPSNKTSTVYGDYTSRMESTPRGDSGSAARFFYCAKASKSDRGVGNTHPTVKPLALMRYLVRLVTPPGGIVLDPFTGSGTTGVAAKAEGVGFIGVEREPEYHRIATARITGEVDEGVEPVVTKEQDETDLLALALSGE
jgi:DNA modification methylase